MAMSKRSKVRIVTLAVLLLVFGSGVLLGLALDRSLVATPVAEEEGRDGERRERRDRGRRYIIERVEMSAEQERQVDSIIEDHRRRLHELQEEFREGFDPRYREIVTSTRESIKEVLTAEQAAAYDSLLAEHRRRRRDREERKDGQGDRR